MTAAQTRDLGVDAAERISAGSYGALVAASTLVGLAEVDMWRLVALVVLTNITYWATHVFAYTIGDRSDTGATIWAVARHHAWVSAPIVSAAFVPVIAVVVLEALEVSQETAVLVGVLIALLFLVGVATTGAVLRRLPTLAVVLIAVATLALSTALVLLKLSLH